MTNLNVSLNYMDAQILLSFSDSSSLFVFPSLSWLVTRAQLADEAGALLISPATGFSFKKNWHFCWIKIDSLTFGIKF